jgi:arylformamidase
MDSSIENEVYLRYTQAQLDLAYTQRHWADNMEEILERWASCAPAIRAASPGYNEFRYGSEPDEVIDLYSAAGKARYAHFHIHGGAWRSQSKDDCAFLAPLMRDEAVNYVVPEFGKLPQYAMSQVFAQLVRALIWTYNNQIATGAAEKLLISGHSSGAHMAALLAEMDWPALGIDDAAILGIVCISGPYDLEPVLLSSRGRYVHLDEDEAVRLSPIRHVARARIPIHLMYGTAESPEFIRQTQAFATALDREQKLAACLEIRGKNHFEIVDALADPDEPAARHLLELFRQPAERPSPERTR